MNAKNIEQRLRADAGTGDALGQAVIRLIVRMAEKTAGAAGDIDAALDRRTDAVKAAEKAMRERAAGKTGGYYMDDEEAEQIVREVLGIADGEERTAPDNAVDFLSLL